jgi:lysophospholipid acyltransferase (LPLAT)-like uncharacterized protein
MKLRNPWLIRAAAAVLAVLVRLWMATMRVRTVSADGRSHPIDPQNERLIYAFWHESLLAPLVTRPQARVLISQHRDGELIAQACQWLGIGVIRGSTSRGGSQALLEMIRGQGNSHHLAITPDGPQGPRRELQAGAVMVAGQTGLRIVPIGVGFSRAWRAPSWDRFAVPAPFSTLYGVLGEPVSIPRELGRADIAHWKLAVQQQMLAATQLAEDWAERVRQQGPQAAPPRVGEAMLRKRSA